VFKQTRKNKATRRILLELQAVVASLNIVKNQKKKVKIKE